MARSKRRSPWDEQSPAVGGVLHPHRQPEGSASNRGAFLAQQPSIRYRLKGRRAQHNFPKMSSRPVLTPGPDHPITIECNPNRVEVRAGDALIADTSAALTLREANYPPVQYIPRADVDMAQLRRSDHSTYCPYKGDAAYFDIIVLGERGRDKVWSYEQPYQNVVGIAECLAFYPDAVDIIEQPDSEITR